MVCSEVGNVKCSVGMHQKYDRKHRRLLHGMCNNGAVQNTIKKHQKTSDLTDYMSRGARCVSTCGRVGCVAAACWTSMIISED